MQAKAILNLVLGAALVGANLFCLNLLLSDFRGARLDLTEGRLFTLAPETKALLAEPEEPLEIIFYHSSIDKLHEKLRPLVGVLADTLKEFEAASSGKASTRIVDWDTAEKSVQERASNTFGVHPAPILVQSSDEEAVRNTYFAVVVSYGDQFERYEHEQLYRVVPTGSSGDFRVDLLNVEYLVAKAVHKVVRGFESIGASLATNNLKASITLFFSPEDVLPKHLKKVPGYAKTVTKKLADEALGRLKVETIDPTGDSPDKKALRAEIRRTMGVREVALDLDGKEGFFSWAVIKVGDASAPLPLVTLGDEMSESDVREAISGQLKAMIPGFLTTVGIATPDAAQNPMAKMMGQPESPQEFKDLVPILQQEFEVREVNLGEGKPIPREISVLVLVRPQDYSDKTLYEIDQFVMRGGRLVVCADAYAFDIDAAMQSGDMNTPKPISIGKFRDMLRSYGAQIGDAMVMDTRCDVLHLARRGASGRRNDVEYFDVKNPYAIFLEGADGIAASHPITQKQNLLRLSWATPVSIATAEAGTDSRPAKPGIPPTVKGAELAWASKDSSTSTDVARAKSLLDSGFNYRPPSGAGKTCVAVALQGTFPSFFADKPIPGKETPTSKPTDSKPADEDSDHTPRLKSSRETSVVVIGDSDFCSPLIQLQAFHVAREALNENLQFLRNSIDFYGPDAQLMGIRNRERVQRPLAALRGMEKDERKSSAALATQLALWLPLTAVVLLGGTWTVLRMNRRPLPLPTRQGGAS